MTNVVQLPKGEPVGPFAKFNQPDSPLFFPVAERPVAWAMRNGTWQPTRSHKAIIRMTPSGDAPLMLNIVGYNYKLVHNRELFHAVEVAMCDEMLPEHLQDVQIKDQVAGFGRVCMRQYVFPSIKCSLPYARSEIAFRIIVQNGYGGSGLRLHAGAIDFFCTNGMVTGEYSSTYRKHTSGLVVGQLNKHVKDAVLQFANGKQKWTAWSQKPVRFEQAMKLFEEIAHSTRMKDGLSDQFTKEVDDRGSTLWAVYSTLTNYASHNDGAFQLRRTVEEQDSVATTMLARELAVAKWVNSDTWKELETV